MFLLTQHPSYLRTAVHHHHEFFVLYGLKYFAYVFFFTKQSQKKVDPHFADRFGQSGRPSPRSTRGISPGSFCPSRASSQCFSQALGASRSQHRRPSLLLMKYGSRGCNAVGCVNTNDHRPTNTRNCFSAPEAVLNEVEQRFDCAQAQTHLLSEFDGGFTLLILNRIPLLQARGQIHSTDRMLSPIEEQRA